MTFLSRADLSEKLVGHALYERHMRENLARACQRHAQATHRANAITATLQNDRLVPTTTVGL